MAELVAERARDAAATERPFDLLVLDPPRVGARPLLHWLPRLSDRIVYISCDPMTLARDAETLARAGLRPRRAIPIDLMPQTYHVETVLLLSR